MKAEPAETSSTAMHAVDHLFSGLRQREPRALGRAISLVEDGAPEAQALLRLCRDAAGEHSGPDRADGRDGQAAAMRIGITGPAGAGKSTLVDALTRELRAQGRRVAIVAVDPSSPFTGGAILGDRIRLADFTADPDVYMRSLATRGHLGGLARAAGDVLAVLEAAGFEALLIETTGVGQGEVEIAALADAVAVVLVPGMGDSVQSLKAGLLEIASVYVLNKADRDGIAQLESEMQEMLMLSHVVSSAAVAQPASSSAASPVSSNLALPGIVKTVATTGQGVPELLAVLEALPRRAPTRAASASALLAAGPLQVAPVLDHLGIAVHSIASSQALYAALGASCSPIETVAHERVRLTMVSLGESRIELLEATEPESVIGRYLQKRGEGLHHVALRVPDLAAAVERMKTQGVRLVSESIQTGAGGHRYVFIHPASANGVLLELVESTGAHGQGADA